LRKFAFVLLVLAVASCSYLKKKKAVDKDAIARVNDEYLDASDIPAITKGLTGKDSVEALKSYAQNWVRKKLLLQKAQENIPEDDPGIVRKVEDYRESLFLYEYEKALISKRLDTTINDDEMKAQYEKLKTAFPLQNDVYQLYFIKLKKDAPDIDNARKWILKPRDEEDNRKMEGYCREYASGASIDKGVWFAKDEVLKNFPLAEADMSSLSASKGYKEFKGPDVIWFIKISDVVKAGQPAPMDFIRNELDKVVTEKRRLDLVEKIYDKIYQDGVKSKSFEILVK
jgi:hypothetical protein